MKCPSYATENEVSRLEVQTDMTHLRPTTGSNVTGTTFLEGATLSRTPLKNSCPLIDD